MRTHTARRQVKELIALLERVEGRGNVVKQWHFPALVDVRGSGCDAFHNTTVTVRCFKPMWPGDQNNMRIIARYDIIPLSVSGRCDTHMTRILEYVENSTKVLEIGPENIGSHLLPYELVRGVWERVVNEIIDEADRGAQNTNLLLQRYAMFDTIEDDSPLREPWVIELKVARDTYSMIYVTRIYQEPWKDAATYAPTSDQIPEFILAALHNAGLTLSWLRPGGMEYDSHFSVIRVPVLYLSSPGRFDVEGYTADLQRAVTDLDPSVTFTSSRRYVVTIPSPHISDNDVIGWATCVQPLIPGARRT